MKFLAVLGMALSACASPTFDKDPTITAMSVTPTPVPKNADGSYSFNVKFSYNDEQNVESWVFMLGTVMVQGNIATPQHIGSTNFNVNLGAGAPSGTLDYTLTITDAMARTSTDGQGTVELSP